MREGPDRRGGCQPAIGSAGRRSAAVGLVECVLLAALINWLEASVAEDVAADILSSNHTTAIAVSARLSASPARSAPNT